MREMSGIVQHLRYVGWEVTMPEWVIDEVLEQVRAGSVSKVLETAIRKAGVNADVEARETSERVARLEKAGWGEWAPDKMKLTTRIRRGRVCFEVGRQIMTACMDLDSHMAAEAMVGSREAAAEDEGVGEEQVSREESSVGPSEGLTAAKAPVGARASSRVVKNGPRGRSRATRAARSKEAYEVQAIVDLKKTTWITPGKKLKYRVRWKGYPESDDTWEYAMTLAKSEELLRAFKLQTLLNWAAEATSADRGRRAAVAQLQEEERAIGGLLESEQVESDDVGPKTAQVARKPVGTGSMPRTSQRRRTPSEEAA